MDGSGRVEGEMNINNMTREEFRQVRPIRKDESRDFNSIVILPARVSIWNCLTYRVRCFLAKLFHLEEPPIWSLSYLHDSGYRCMSFIGCRKGEAICRVGYCSDVINLDGIGGYGHNWYEMGKGVPGAVPVKGWSMDCLNRSGLLRLFVNQGYVLRMDGLSSFEIFAVKEE